MRLLTVLLFGVFLVATQVFLVLKAMQDNLFERDVDPVDAVMERQASISDELTPQERLWLSKNHTVRVGVDPDFYPLEKFDAEGRYTGHDPLVIDALDWYGTWKLFDGLTDAAFYNRNRQYALGATPEQTGMGQWSDGTPVKPIKVLK